MDKFLDTCTLPSLNQEEVETLNRSITRAEVEAVLNSLPIKKAQVQMGSQPNSIRHTKRSWYNSLWNYSRQSQKRESSSKSFYETNIILIPKASRNSIRKANFRPISMMNTDAKIFNKMANWLQKHFKKLIHHTQVGFILGCKRGSMTASL